VKKKLPTFAGTKPAFNDDNPLMYPAVTIITNADFIPRVIPIGSQPSIDVVND